MDAEWRLACKALSISVDRSRMHDTTYLTTVDLWPSAAIPAVGPIFDNYEQMPENTISPF